MSAITRLVSSTFADLSQKRQSKRLVHDESAYAGEVHPSTTPDDNPNFNVFDPADHLGGNTAPWHNPSPSSRPTTSDDLGSSGALSPTSTSSSSEASTTTKKGLPLKNMVRKLKPFNNNSKEAKDRNTTPKAKEEAKPDEKKAEKKSVWKLKDQIDRRRGGDRQMLIEIDGDSL